jgi:hypothetical protein
MSANENSGSQSPATFPNGVLISGAAVLRSAAVSEVRIRLDAENGRVSVYKSGTGGEIRVNDPTDNTSLWLLGNAGTLIARGDALLGPPSSGIFPIELRANGEISVHHYVGPTVGVQRALHFHPSSARLTLGMEHAGGAILLKHSASKDAVRIDSYPMARITVGDVGVPGEILIKDANGDTQIQLDATRGDILIGNADCAEEFAVSETVTSSDVEPGTVMIVNDEGFLEPSTEAQDERLVGVVAGACGHRPGVVLGCNRLTAKTVRVALLGTVHCKASLESGPIRPGTLLTSSSTQGHAMAVAVGKNRRGTVIGKAMGALNSETGMVPILVTLY